MSWTEFSPCLAFDATLNFRRNWLVFAVGEQGVWLSETRSFESRYVTIGKSWYELYGEGILSIGISRNKLFYHTESARGTIESDYYYGLQLGSQVFVHLRQVFGLGLTLNANINKEVSCFNFLIAFKIGAWNF